MASPGVVGTRIDRYEVQSLLGVGGFGNVYRARHLHTDAKVALKLLKKQLGADQEMLERFLREARAAAAVGSDHIVRVLDANVGAEGQPFIAFELLEGWDLKEFTLRQGALPWERLVDIAIQALEGLAAAHAKGVVHRDIKPANVFVVQQPRPDGSDGDFVKLLDFGISKMHSESATGLTNTGMAMGTPSYMAPEQFFDAKHVDARADLYSMSVILFELLTGRLPYQADSYAEVVVKVRTETPPKLASLAPRLPAELCAAVDRGLSKEKELRFASAKEMADVLRAVLGRPRASAPPAPGRPIPLEQTATPATPNVIASPSLVREAKAVAPTPMVQTAPPAPPAGPTPVNLAAPAQPTPLSLSPAQPLVKKGLDTWVWVVISVIVFFGGCCFFTALMSQFANQGDAPAEEILHPAPPPRC